MIYDQNYRIYYRNLMIINALKYIFENQRSLYLISYAPPKRKTFLPIDFYEDEEINYVEEGCDTEKKINTYIV